MTSGYDNPYRSPSAPLPAQDSGTGKPLGCLATLFLANVISLGVAVIVGEALSFFVLLPPMNRWFSMNGEFDGLILIGMPMWVGGFSLMTATILGATYPRRFSATIAITVGMALIAAFFWNITGTGVQASEWYSALTVSVILLIAITAGVLAAHRGLKRIHRMRSAPTAESETRNKTRPRLRMLLAALTALYGVINAAVLWMIFQDTISTWLFPLSIFGLVFGLGVIVICAYQAAARSEIRALAILCLTLLISSLGVTMYLWIHYIWFRAN